MKRIAILLVACGSSKSAPAHDAAPLGPPAWKVNVAVEHPMVMKAEADTITLDGNGVMHHSDYRSDLGTWQIAPDRVQAIAALALAPDLLAPPVETGAEEGDAPEIAVTVHTAAGDQEKRYRDDAVPESIARLQAALDALVTAHDLDNLAAVGPFTVDVGDSHIDSAGPAPRAALARVATVLLSPPLAAVKDTPDSPHGEAAQTVVITRGGTTRRITSTVPWPEVLDALESAVSRAEHPNRHGG